MDIHPITSPGQRRPEISVAQSLSKISMDALGHFSGDSGLIYTACTSPSCDFIPRRILNII
jgi:hypothetical protein